MAANSGTNVPDPVALAKVEADVRLDALERRIAKLESDADQRLIEKLDNILAELRQMRVRDTMNQRIALGQDGANVY